MSLCDSAMGGGGRRRVEPPSTDETHLMKTTQLDLLAPLQPLLRRRARHISTPRIDGFALLLPSDRRVQAEVLAGREAETEEGTVVDVVDIAAESEDGSARRTRQRRCSSFFMPSTKMKDRNSPSASTAFTAAFFNVQEVAWS